MATKKKTKATPRPKSGQKTGVANARSFNGELRAKVKAPGGGYTTRKVTKTAVRKAKKAATKKARSTKRATTCSPKVRGGYRAQESRLRKDINSCKSQINSCEAQLKKITKKKTGKKKTAKKKAA